MIYFNFIYYIAFRFFFVIKGAKNSGGTVLYITRNTSSSTSTLLTCKLALFSRRLITLCWDAENRDSPRYTVSQVRATVSVRQHRGHSQRYGDTKNPNLSTSVVGRPQRRLYITPYIIHYFFGVFSIVLLAWFSRLIPWFYPVFKPLELKASPQHRRTQSLYCYSQVYTTLPSALICLKRCWHPLHIDCAAPLHKLADKGAKGYICEAGSLKRWQTKVTGDSDV